MDKLQMKAQQLVKGMTDHVIREEMEEWPPKCNGSLFYQLKRPDCSSSKTDQSAIEKE